MKLFEEFKLYETMWDEVDHKDNFNKKADLDFKRALIKALKDNNKSLAKQVNDCNIVCTDKIAAGTAVYKQGTIYVHTNLSATEQMDNAIAAIKKALASIVTEAVLTTAADKKFKTALISALENKGRKNLAKQIHSCDVISSTEIDPDTVSIKNGTIKIPTDLYSIEKIDRVTELITQAVSSIQQHITEEIDDPYGYGPYKTFSDPDLQVGDYVLAPRPFASSGKTYPAKITGISARWIDYEISGFGFTDKGTKARPGSQAADAINKAKNYLKN